jgi:hypothetical protein
MDASVSSFYPAKEKQNFLKELLFLRADSVCVCVKTGLKTFLMC